MGLLLGNNTQELLQCDPASGQLADLYQDLEWERPVCTGCDGLLNLPSCQDVQMVLYSGKRCQDDAVKRRDFLAPGSCWDLPDPVKLYPKQGPFSWMLMPATPRGDLSCVAPDAKIQRPKVKRLGRARGCQAQAFGRCDEPNTVCANTQRRPACVYRKGDHACPQIYGSQKKLLYTSYQDRRGCSECEVVLSDDHVSCQGKITFFGGPGCDVSEKSGDLEYPLPDVPCDGHGVFEARDWWHISVTEPKLVYDGECRATGWEPQGDVIKQDPVTLCCQDDQNKS